MFSRSLHAELAEAGQALSAAGLVTAFGHVSARTAAGTLLITPPQPLGSVTASDAGFTELAPDAAVLPDGVPREAWIHLALAASRPGIGAVCRAQPRAATAAAAAGLPLRPLHGQGALLGPQVPVFQDPRLVRDPARAEALAEAMGDGVALVMRGNGAVSVGETVGEAAARMWLLEESARLTLAASAAGTPVPLADADQQAWRATGSELLNRIWQYLISAVPRDTAERNRP
ncbi:class II aldolase/adducin family protein [Streptomyces sp. enrichment culture]|uniref:class II aldolase/adducin family protein n=1 Tax=Streptomyces sp. enrichment culture TaxID=1795815 RepID=UPI003F569A64